MITIYLLLVIIIINILISSSNIHGGIILALNGKDSILLATDTRWSSYATGPYLIGQFHRYVFRVGSRCIVGCYGLDSDSIDMIDYLREKTFKLKDTDIGPEQVTRLVSNYLYKSHIMTIPIIIGFKDDGSSYICSMDGLGALTESNTYAILGTASQSLYALCESNYQLDLNPTQLLVVAEKILTLALQRDVKSGGNINILTLMKDSTVYVKDFETFDV